MAQKKEKQDDRNLALLKSRLQLPLIVRQLLKSGEKMEGETKYAIHTLLGDLDPVQALLCAAFCLKEIADYEGLDFSGYNFLHTECNRLIKRYAHAHLFMQEGHAGQTESVASAWAELAEDLENFSEMLDLCRLSFEVVGPHSFEILEILSIQIDAQALIAEEVSGQTGTAKEKTAPLTPIAAQGNVIPFPHLRRG